MGIDIERLKTDAAYWDEVCSRECVKACVVYEGADPKNYYKIEFHTSWQDPVYCGPKSQVLCIPRPTKPAGMEWDGEGYPPVGCECEGRADPGYPWLRGVIMYSSPDGAVFKPNDGGKELFWLYRTLNAEFRPLQTKEQREREDLLEILYMDEPLEVRADAILSKYNLEPKP